MQPEATEVDLTQMSPHELDEFAAWCVAVHPEKYENVSIVTEWEDPHDLNQPLSNNLC